MPLSSLIDRRCHQEQEAEDCDSEQQIDEHHGTILSGSGET
jgi:hypothetical protein